ncbi:AAA family ATPase [Anaerolineales bacterium HSG25]|nr:AAA family ATPase [Anaerolineales bacterium HSG25]
MLKFPYGLSSYYDIITEGYIYVDRTQYIRTIEDAGKHLLFLRPRRFGKSLWLSTLFAYYDLDKADEFGRLFSHLAIGQNPTPLHNQYFILKWDFSNVSPLGNAEQIQQSLYDYLNDTIKAFRVEYRHLLTDATDLIEIHPTNALSSFQSLLLAVRQTSHKLYLLIDEYDNFANELLMGQRDIDPDRYKTLVHGEGCLKLLFKVIKSAASDGGIDRTFITGVSPVVMSDVTSGHNIAKNIYLDHRLNDLCGFTEAEVIDMVDQIAQTCQPMLNTDEVVSVMRTFYDGYSFAEDNKTLIYNPTLTLYFFEHLKQQCKYPSRILDSNLAMDRNKIIYISRLVNGNQIIMEALNETEPVTIHALADRFGVEDILYNAKDNRFMVSLLYYFGVLTLTDQRSEFGDLVFTIPNLVIRQLYVERLQELLYPEATDKNEAINVARMFYRTADLAPVAEFIENHYFKLFDNRDYRWANELTLKTVFLTLLFNDTFYIMDSETVLDRHYADMTMIVRPDMRQYQLLDFLFEFKYISLKTLGLTADEIQQKDYATLKALPKVTAQLDKAKTKLTGYQQTVQQKVGSGLRLHTYAVVSLGFERLVWEKV